MLFRSGHEIGTDSFLDGRGGLSALGVEQAVETHPLPREAGRTPLVQDGGFPVTRGAAATLGLAFGADEVVIRFPLACLTGRGVREGFAVERQGAAHRAPLCEGGCEA